MERFVEKRFEIWQPLQYQVISNERQNTQTHIFQKSINVSLCRTFILLHMRKLHSVVDRALTGWVSENRVFLVV